MTVARRLLIVAVAAALLAGCDRGQPGPVETASSPAGSTACVPEVSESGFSAVRKVVRFGLVVTSACTQAAVNSLITVAALDAAGRELPLSDGPDPALDLPVLLPGQQLGLGGELFLSADAMSARRLAVKVTRTQNLPAAAFAGWPRTVQVTGLTHTGPDMHGDTDVSGTTVVDPPGVALCNPAYYLILRNAKNTIVYGARARQAQPQFTGDVPAGVDWSTAQISVVQGVMSLAGPVGATLSCRTP